MASCPPSRNALTLRLSTPVGDDTDDDDGQLLFLSGIVNNNSSGLRVVQQTSDRIQIPSGRVLAPHSSQLPHKVKAASSVLDGEAGVMKITFALAREESDGSFGSPVKPSMK